jgi:hypothetical protein
VPISFLNWKKKKKKEKNPEKRFSFFRNEFRDRHCIETRLCATSLGYGRIWKIKNWVYLVVPLLSRCPFQWKVCSRGTFVVYYEDKVRVTVRDWGQYICIHKGVGVVMVWLYLLEHTLTPYTLKRSNPSSLILVPILRSPLPPRIPDPPVCERLLDPPVSPFSLS